MKRLTVKSESAKVLQVLERRYRFPCSLQLIDIRRKKSYMLYAEANNTWGYNKVAIVDKLYGRFQLLFIVAEGKND